ncbi:MAG: NAD(P)-dependent oxidoreductase [Crocinitomicaceae bacterium]|nr:NAD(P)-dependent oxidoreductase [Crocinitomicaceae bacterium]
MKKVAVFGGSGFLGTYLVDELIERDYEVYALDLVQSQNDSKATFIQLDILNRDQIDQAFDKYQFDIVYNLAGFANLDKAIEFPVETFQLNVMGNMYILEASRKHNVDRFVYASSAYAMSDKGAFYGLSKLSSEKVIEEYEKKYNFPFTILRYGSLYSDQDFENNYIYNLVKRCVDTGEINHGGDGEEIREYIHAEDAAKLSVDVIESEAYRGKHIILTGVERMKRIELFHLINEIMGGKIKINLKNDGYSNHYKFTPYSFSPEESQKLIPNPYIDMGQGILNCIKKAHEK